MSDKHQDPEKSGLVLYGIGRAANNKALKDANGNPETSLEVTPVEQLSMMDGELISLPFDSEVQGQKADGSTYNAKVTLNTAITAKWVPMGSNRRTPPDIRRGERVYLYRYKDTDQFFWKETGWDDHLRRLETVHFRFSATADENADMSDPRNWYHLQISTHQGIVHFETARANGEKAKYALQINCKDGVAALADDFGNFFQIESIAKSIAMQNGDGTLLQLDKKKFYGYAPQVMHLVAEESMTLETKVFKLSCQTGEIDASSAFKIKTPNFDLEANTNTFKGQSTFTDQVTLQQHLNANGISSPLPIQGPNDTI